MRMLRWAVIPVAVAASGEAFSTQTDSGSQRFAPPSVRAYDEYAQKGGEAKAAADFKKLGAKLKAQFGKDKELASEAISEAKKEAQRRSRAIAQKAEAAKKQVSKEMGSLFKSQLGPTELIEDSEESNAGLAAAMDKHYASMFGGGASVGKEEAIEGTSTAREHAESGISGQSASSQKLAENLQKYYSSQYVPHGVSFQGGGAGGVDQAEVQRREAKQAEKIGNYYAGLYAPKSTGANGGEPFFAAKETEAAEPATLEGSPEEMLLTQGPAEPATPQSAEKCHTIKDLNTWRDAQLKVLDKYVPKEYQHFANSGIVSQYKTNCARIKKEEAAAAGADSVGARQGPAREPALPRPITADNLAVLPPLEAQAVDEAPTQAVSKLTQVMLIPACLTAGLFSIIFLRRRWVSSTPEMSVYLIHP